MESRYASISFDDFQIEISSLEHTGLAQGSPLSPILFRFFNSDLVDQPVDYYGGASAFIDNYFRWRAGPSAEDNVRKIQEEDILRIKVNIALGGLRHLRLEQMRQLYQVCVTPIVDYASTVWHNPLKDKVYLRTL
ncbi:hypothetical protein TSTA_110090, partial [Talaromyces stipitatus ATCC 10500]